MKMHNRLYLVLDSVICLQFVWVLHTFPHTSRRGVPRLSDCQKRKEGYTKKNYNQALPNFLKPNKRGAVAWNHTDQTCNKNRTRLLISTYRAPFHLFGDVKKEQEETAFEHRPRTSSRIRSTMCFLACCSLHLRVIRLGCFV